MPTAKRAKKRAAPAKQRPTPRLLVVGDAAASAGISLWHDGKLVAHSVADGTSFRSLWQVVKPMLAPYDDIPQRDRVALIEEGFISFMSVKGSLTLGRRRGLMQAAFECAGFTRFEFPLAATWQSWAFNRTRPADTKAESIRLVEQHLGFTPESDDVADSINIARFYLSQCTALGS